MKGDVLGDASEHDHGRMRVHVDESRDDGLAGAVHGFVCDEAFRLGEGEDAVDALPLDEEVDGGAVQLDVPQKNHSPKSKKPAARGRPVQGLEFVEVHVGEGLARGALGVVPAALDLPEAGADERDGVLEPLGELLEVLLIEENLVLVVGESAVVFLAALAFGDGQVEIVVPLRGLDIEKVGTLSGTDRLRIDVFRVSLLGAGPLVIFTVHDYVLKFDLFTNVGKLFKIR